MFSLHANVDRLRAEGQLDAASVASFPHLAERNRRSWLKSHDRRRRAVIPPQPVAAESLVPAGGNDAPFTVDGVPVGPEGLQKWLAYTFGAQSPMSSPGRLTPTAAARRNGHGQNAPSQGAVRA